MVRVVFPKGEQKKFLNSVVELVGSPSLRGLLQFGLETNYTSLKNFYSERRSLPRELFLDLCTLAKIDSSSLAFEEKADTWGKSIGGRKSKRGKNLKAAK